MSYCDSLRAGLPRSHLDILNQLLGWGVDRGLGVRHVLNGAGPPGGLVEQLGIEPIAVLASVHGDVPVACNSNARARTHTHGSMNLGDQGTVPVPESQKSSTQAIST